MVRKRSGRRNQNRKDKANTSVVQLSNIINSPKVFRNRIRDVAARDLLKLGKKHGTRGNSATNSNMRGNLVGCTKYAQNPPETAPRLKIQLIYEHICYSINGSISAQDTCTLVIYPPQFDCPFWRSNLDGTH